MYSIMEIKNSFFREYGKIWNEWDSDAVVRILLYDPGNDEECRMMYTIYWGGKPFNYENAKQKNDYEEVGSTTELQ